MALGCSTYSLTRQFNRYKITKAGKRILGLLEIICYVVVFRYACTEMDVKYSFPVIFVMWVAVILSFSDINPCHQFFDKPIFSWMGRVSLLIYLNQFYAIRLVQELLPNIGFPLKALLCSLVTFAGAFLCDRVVGWFINKKPLSMFVTEGKGE